MRARIATLSFFLIACVEPPYVDVNVVLVRTLTLGDFETVEIRIVDQERQVIEAATVSGLELSTTGWISTFDLNALELGQTYRLELRAAGALCTAMGRSSWFAHRPGSYDLAVQVGCADQFQDAPTDPIEDRLAHRMITDNDGSALIVGGATEVGLEDYPTDALHSSVERYDPTTGTFTSVADMSTARAAPALLTLPDSGGIGIIGGVSGEGVTRCAGTIEVLSGSSIVPAIDLAQPRCTPAAALLPETGHIAVTGGSALSANRNLDGEIFDASLEERLVDSVPGQVYRSAPLVFPLSSAAAVLVIGGTQQDPPVEWIRFESGDFISEPIAVEGWSTTGLSHAAASYVPCQTGGGSVYVTGGLTRNGQTRQASDRVYCYRDDPNASAAASFHYVGRLADGKRSRHVSVVIDGPNDAPRLLLIGGTADDSTDFRFPHDNAIYAEVSGCDCTMLEPEDFGQVSLPSSDLALLHDATVLGDGAVLLLYGTNLVDETGFVATGKAALFIPDYGWDL